MPGRDSLRAFIASTLAVTALMPHARARAQEGSTAGPGSASMHISRAEIPFSTLASAEARATLAKLLTAAPGPDFRRDIAAARRFYDGFNNERLAEMRARYSVSVTSETIAGVRVDVVVPTEHLPARNRDRVLINLHGGAFMRGAGSGALVEAVPIAATSRIKVIAVDYRMAPEHRFPAASADVAAVYRTLLKTHKAGDIGIYGCSAGGILTAQSVAWFAAHELPRPGAIVTLCATGAELDGDSAYVAPVLTGQPPVPAGAKPPLLLADLPYFEGVDRRDPLAFPAVSREVLAGFPPTLLIAGGRDYSTSSMTTMHRRLREAGVDAELFVFDGLWHAFFVYPGLPESRETYAIIGRFFDDRLGAGKRQ